MSEINLLKQKAGIWTAPPALIEGLLCAALQCSDPIHLRTYKNENAYENKDDAERDKQLGLQELSEVQKAQRDALLGRLEAINGQLIELPATAWIGVVARLIQEIVAKPMREARLAALDCTPNPYNNLLVSAFSFANKRSVDVVLGTKESIASPGIHHTLLMCGRALGESAGPLVGAAVENNRPVSELLRLMALALSGDTIKAAGQLNYANGLLSPRQGQSLNFHQPSDETLKHAKDWILLISNASLALRCVEQAAAIDALSSPFRENLSKAQQMFRQCFGGGSVDDEATHLLAILSSVGISQNQRPRTLSSIPAAELEDLDYTLQDIHRVDLSTRFLASPLFSVFFREFDLAKAILATNGKNKKAIQLLAAPSMKMGWSQLTHWKTFGFTLHDAEFRDVLKPFR